MDNIIFRNSGSVKVINRFLRRYSHFQDRIEISCKESLFFSKTLAFHESMKRHFGESFLFGIIGKKKKLTDIIKSSEVIGLLKVSARKGADKTAGYFEGSEIKLLIWRMGTDVIRGTLGFVGIVCATAIITNIVISTVLKTGFDLFGWAIRIVFLPLSMAMMFSGTLLKDANDSSVFARLFGKGKKI